MYDRQISPRRSPVYDTVSNVALALAFTLASVSVILLAWLHRG